MPEDDIYGNKKRYESFLASLDLFLIEPKKRTDKNRKK